MSLKQIPTVFAESGTLGIPRVNIQTTCRKPMVSIGKCSGAQLSPPPLAQCCSSKSSLRAVAGDVTEAVWGASSLGALLKAKRPDMEVIPSPQLRCGSWRNWMGRFVCIQDWGILPGIHGIPDWLWWVDLTKGPDVQMHFCPEGFAFIFGLKIWNEGLEVIVFVAGRPFKL